MQITEKALKYYDSAINFIKNHITHDDKDTFFLLKELNRLRTEAKEVKFPNLISRDAFSVVSNLGAGYRSWSSPVYNMAGKAEVIEGGADVPVVNTSRSEITAKVKTIGASYTINNLELESALRNNLPIENRKLLTAIRAIEEKIDEIAFFGDKKHGLLGLLSKTSDNTVVTIPNDGTGSSKKWVDKTTDKIERDLLLLLQQIPEPFQNYELQLILTPENYFLLSTKRIDNTSDSLLSYIQKVANITSIFKTNKLKGAVNNKDVSVLLPKSPEVCELIIPRDREVRPPFQHGRELVVDVICDISGLATYHPKAVIITDEC